MPIGQREIAHVTHRSLRFDECLLNGGIEAYVEGAVAATAPPNYNLSRQSNHHASPL